MPRGDFAKAFGEYRKSGGTMSRRDFADKWNQEHGKPFKPHYPIPNDLEIVEPTTEVNKQ